jgi:hypothetical protein
MNNFPSIPDSIVRINHELHRFASAEHSLPLVGAGSALAISDACTAFRRIRIDVDEYVAWLEVHGDELVPLVRLLIQIADTACRARR